MTEDRPRLFVGVPLPEELRATVRRTQAALRAPGLRPVEGERLHVTLAFLGEVDPDVASAAERVVSELRASMGGVVLLGGFVLLPSPRKVRVVALGIEDVGGVLEDLYTRVWEGLAVLPGVRRETRPFRPHLTIGRMRQGGVVRPKSDTPREAFRVQSVRLYRSRLSHGGAEYEVLTEAVLRDREDT